MFCNCSVIFLSTKWTFQTLTPKLQSAGGSTPTDVSLLRDPQIHQWDPGSKRSTATKGATKMRSVTNLVFFVFFSPSPKKKDASFFGRIPKTLMKGLKKGLAEGVCSISNPKLVAIAVLFKAASLRGLFQHTSLEAHRVSDEKLHVLFAHGVLEAIIPPCDVRGHRSCASNVFWNYMIIAFHKDIW